MGIGLPILSSILLPSCGKSDVVFPTLHTSFSGKIVIIGAGAAGLAAGYLLKRYGIDFEIIEAAPVYGGRLKKSSHFADFPIDLGAEWIHTDPKILADIINNPHLEAHVDTIVYNPQTIKSWNNGRLKSHNYIKNFYSEWKFKRTTWFDFFEEFIIPEISDKIVLNQPISEINYQGDKVLLTSHSNDTFEADKVLITTSVKTLQMGQITFQPSWPAEKTEALNSIFMGDGIKMFIEFKERFYPDILAFGNVFQALDEEEKFVYDAAFRKDSNKHILGLFAINDQARAYTQLLSEDEMIARFLAELDEIFDGKASAHYVRHIIQNWSDEPFIQGAYSYSFDGNRNSIVSMMQEPLSDKIYFAGEALSLDYQSTVHGACESAYNTIAKMMQ